MYAMERPLVGLTGKELLAIWAWIKPPGATKLRRWSKDKGELAARIEACALHLPEAETFSAPTAGVLIERLLKYPHLSAETIVTVVRRRHPNSRINVHRVEQIRRLLRIDRARGLP